MPAEIWPVVSGTIAGIATVPMDQGMEAASAPGQAARTRVTQANGGPRAAFRRSGAKEWNRR